jgi:hypothetical protein
MLKLRLLSCESDADIEKVLDAHQKRFHVTIERLKGVCSELDPGRVRRLSLNALNEQQAR